MSIPIPPLDPMPVPSPVWLLKTLSTVTFFIHVLLMNLVMGGSLMAAVYGFKGREKHLVAARSLAKTLPWAMPFAITFGVAPLLFMQVLYGPLFYSATIALGVPFLMVIPVLIAAYYLVYALSWKWETLGAKRPWIALLIFGLSGYVGFAYSNAFSLMLDPGRIHSKALAHPGGFQLNLVEPTLYPRFLHMFFGAVAVTGLFIAFLGIRKLEKDAEQGRWQYRSGATWFAGATIVSMVVGIWWMLVLPREVLKTLMGGDMASTIVFALGALAGLGALVAILMAINSRRPRRLVLLGKGCLAVTLLCMIVTRDRLRDATLADAFSLDAMKTLPQWGTILLFLGVFVLGLLAAYWLIREFARGVEPDPEDSGLGKG